LRWAAATDDGARITRLFSGRPNRVMRSRFMDEMRDAEELVAPFPAQISLMAPLRQDPGGTQFLRIKQARRHRSRARCRRPIWSGP